MAALEGFLKPAEGERLAELASQVPLDRAIVEIGSYKGKSSSYLGVGSRYGCGAPVYCVDLWELHRRDGYSDPTVFGKWREQVESFGLADLVTSIRAESGLMGRLLSVPIGMLFIDGDHGYESVLRDFGSWSRQLQSGAILAFHDYDNTRYGVGVRQFIEEEIKASPRWTPGQVIHSLFVTTKASDATPVDLPAPGPSPATAPELVSAIHDPAPANGYTFVSNRELQQHLAVRPPQYAFDLALIVKHRDETGIYIDMHSPHYQALLARYRDSGRHPPLVTRVEEICRTCQVGAECSFPRLPEARREELLQRENQADWPRWCPARAWGSAIDVVYPYIDDEAEGDELRFSLRSVEKYLQAVPTVWVVGDKPLWYIGNHIPHERLKVNRHRARLDRAAKLWLATNDPRIGDDFIWMMDDVYFTQPLTLHEIRIPFKAYEMDASLLPGYRPRNQWQREKLLGWQALAKAGRPLDDFTAHLPFIYVKDKLRVVFEKYDLLNQPYVDPVIYFNEFSTAVPRHCDEILYTERGRPAADTIRRKLQPTLIMNHACRGFSPAMREVLEELYPEPSKYEQS